MAGQELKARGRSVKKMTREGLTEENLKEGTVTDISSKEEGAVTMKGTDYSLDKRESAHASPDRVQKTNRRYRNVREGKLKKERSSQEPSEKPVLFSFEEKRDLLADGSVQEDSLSEHKDLIVGKQKRKQLYEVQRKSGRLSFSEPFHRAGSRADPVRHRAGKAEKLSGVLGDSSQEKEDENPAAEGVYAGQAVVEEAAGKLREAQTRSNRTSGRLMRKGYQEEGLLRGNRLRFASSEETAWTEQAKNAAEKAEAKRKKRANKFWQRKRYKDAYRAARKAGASTVGGGIVSADGVVTENLTEKAKRVAREVFAKNQAVFLTLGVSALIFILVSVSLFSCSASIQGAGSLIRITTYQSTDQDIYAAENAYRALESALDTQISQMESAHPGHEDYRYQVDEIGHNPYHLISYLTAKYGVWTYRDIRDELQGLFEQQYKLETAHEPVNSTTTKIVRVGESLGNVVTSGYCNCYLCSGPWAGGPTASGVMPTANHTIAVDRNNPTVPMGTKVVMNGIEYTVEDTGNFDRYGVDFDVYYDVHSAAQAHGHQTWEAYIADDNGTQEVEVRVTNTRDTFSTTLTNSGFDAVARADLSAEELKIYDALNITLGNRDYLFDQSNAYAGGGGMDYTVPPEALSDAQAARMIREAQRHLGTPYVWGGSSPGGFDCSGFVSYVINHCGNGWDFGRCTANELRNRCAYVPPDMAKPGDLIFFKNTYATSGASHVGIYLGNGMMIHCGKPVQYASINRDYWKKHFLSFGRLP